MQRVRDSLRTAVLTALLVVLSVAVLWIMIRQLLVIIGLIAVALLALRLVFGGRRAGARDCGSCGRELPADAQICPHCFELQTST